MRLWLSILTLAIALLPRVDVVAQSNSATGSTTGSTEAQLYGQLDQIVAAEAWDQAIEIVDRLLDLQPQREQELQDYRERLASLAESAESEPAPSQVEILRARGEVFSTRTERRQRQPEDRFIRDARDVAVVIVPNVGAVLATEYPIAVQLPDQYGVDVTFAGAVGETEEVQVTVTLAGGGEQAISQTIPVGGSVAVTRETFVFSSSRVPAPSRVTVEIENGKRRSFPISLPARNVVISESRISSLH